jgi:acyl-coenzyme A synthetase/AMP-(fatty) acid ligase
MGDAWGCYDCLTLMYLGATIVIAQEKSVLATIAEINEKNISTLVLLPWQLRLYLKEAKPGEMLLPGISFLFTGGSTLTLSEKEQVMAKITPHLYDSYDTTEFCHVSMAGPSDHSKKPGTVGSVREGVEVQVVDDDHHPLDPGGIGMLRFRTTPMIREYLNNPDATARSFRDGWFYPMDVGYLDVDGYLFLTGRSDDRIDCMGAKFYPVEVERILLTYPGIEEAIVFGWPDTIKGEVAAAAYVSTEPLDAREIVSFCKSRLKNYMVPRYCIGLEFIPRNRNGKAEVRTIKGILKRSIRDGKKSVQH